MPHAEAPTPLAGVFPPRLVARLHRERFEGTLRLHGGGAIRVIYFRRGEIASAASNADEDRLPNILIREGRLTEPQVEMARAKQRPGASLGKTLIELGFLSPTELLQGARRQVRQILAAAFALREGTSQESPGPLPPEVTVLGLPVRRLIFDALLEVGDRQTVVQEMGSMETIYRPSAEMATALPTLRLEPQHEEVARLVDGCATLREISGRVRLDDLTVSKIVLALEILGLVEQESPAEGAAPGGRRIPVIADEEEETADERFMPISSETWTDASGTPATIAPEAAPIAPAPAPIAPAPTAIAAAPAGITAVPPPIAAAPPAITARPAPPASFRRYEPEAASPPYPPSEPEAATEPDRSEDALAFEEEAETPPIPPGELPAFAAPPNIPTGWSVDPETGEKVHLGPVELTFDGPVVPPRHAGVDRGRLALFGTAGMLAVAAVVTFFVVRGNGASETEALAPETIAARAAATDAAPTGRAAEDPSDGAPSTPETAETPGEGADAPEGNAAAPGQDAEPPPAVAAPPTTATPPRSETAPAPSVVSGGAAGTAADFGFGQRLLDAGTVDRAAEVFRRAIQPIPAGQFTLQTMIACEADTVRKARAGTRPDAGLFVLPIAMRGRGCFRVMWGVFETREAAEAARSELPRYFVSSGVSPAVVSIDRLRSSS